MAVVLPLLLVLALLVSAGAAAAAPEPSSCRSELPRGPAVPEPVVFRNSCAGFLLHRDGRVSRLSRDWLAARSGGTGRRYGADLRIVRNPAGRIVLRREGRLVWRSSALYRNDAGSIAFGPHAFAFAAYRRGIYLTDLRGRERLVLRGLGLYPVAFRRDGSLLVVAPGADASIHVLSRDGSALRRYRYLSRNGYAFDELSESVFFVTPERALVRLDGTDLRVVRSATGLGGWIWLTGRYLTFSGTVRRGPSDELRYTLLERDGRTESRWRWLTPRRSRIDYSPIVSEDGRAIAFRTVTDGRRPRVVVYVFRRGDRRPTPLLRHRGRQVGCGISANFAWDGGVLLYTASDGPATIVDLRDGTRVDLTRIASKLPSRAPGERGTAHWLRDFAPAASG